MQLLRDGGRLGFITSGSWVRGNFGGPLRKFLTENGSLESMIDFGEFQPFEDAEMIRPSITIVRKSPQAGELRLFKWLTSGKPPENLSECIANAPTMRTDHLGEAAWELETDAVLTLRQKLSAGGVALSAYTKGHILYGIKTGLNDVFVIDTQTKEELTRRNKKSAEIIKPFVQGTHFRPWYVEDSPEYLIFARRGIQIRDYPAVHDYLSRFREQLEPKPREWPRGKKWKGRKPGAYEWYELQDTVDYWEGFEQPKIVWPDISKLPRFSMDIKGRYLGNTGYAIPGGDYYLLGVLSSWATWFYISKTAQPLRLRAERWQYRLIAQFMEHVPIPPADKSARSAIAKLSRKCCDLGTRRYELQSKVQKRLVQTVGTNLLGEPDGELNNKAQQWWTLTLNELGAALKSSFKLKSNPFSSPKTADEWEPYLAKHRREVERLTRELADAEAEINDRVYRLFQLTPDEIKLLKREVEH